jgi:hypothetical protein
MAGISTVSASDQPLGLVVDLIENVTNGAEGILMNAMLVRNLVSKGLHVDVLTHQLQVLELVRPLEAFEMGDLGYTVVHLNDLLDVEPEKHLPPYLEPFIKGLDRKVVVENI